jgi:hypothetical protein
MHINGRNPFDRRIGGLFRLTNLELRLLSRAHRATDSIHGRVPVDTLKHASGFRGLLDQFV